MHRKKSLLTIALLGCFAASSAGATTSVALPDWLFTEGGWADHGGVGAVGMGWHLPWSRATASGRFSTRLEAHVARWWLQPPGGSSWQGYQFVLLPLLRHTWLTTTVPVFVEGGIGLSYLDQQRPHGGSFEATRWNFHDTLAVGLQFGEHRQYELSLRLVHQSNGGVHKPNPGMNSAQVRWAVSF
ncbi:MAG TPA: acyloxyacyl hydrolase [Ramlibacter sp.]|jgi:hypothetical protein|nr:acyloxyacyl hydrolase [Ramlibacter sp.]